MNTNGKATMQPGTNQLWLTALISGGILSVFAGLLILIRVPQFSHATLPLSPQKRSFSLMQINMSHPDALAEDADLLDPVPLFSPTAHNTSVLEVPVQQRREPGTHFPPFEGRFLYKENSFDLYRPFLAPSSASPIEALNLGKMANIFSDLGKRGTPNLPLQERLAFIEVVQAQTGAVVYSRPVTGPAPVGFPTGDWRSIETIATVDVSGLVGTPTVTTGGGSGSDEVDAFFTHFLAKRFHLGGRMAPGVYIIRIGP